MEMIQSGWVGRQNSDHEGVVFTKLKYRFIVFFRYFFFGIRYFSVFGIPTSVSVSVPGLFQMYGPQSAKARRPNWVLVRRTTAALVVMERSRRWVPTELNSTRYIGHRWWRTWCISDASLNVMRYLTGIQCKSCRAAVVCDRRSRPSTSRAAAFRARWSGISVKAGRPTRTELTTTQF